MMKDCQHIAGLLPWLLNDSLKPVERAEVRTHLADCEYCRSELGETAFVFRMNEQHAPTELLVAFAFDDSVADSDAGLLRGHLAVCADCAEQLEMTRESLRWVENQETSSKVLKFPTEKMTIWKSLWLWQYVAMAASIIGIVALGGWFATWRQSQNELAELMAQQRRTEDRLSQLEAENQKAEAKPAQVPIHDDGDDGHQQEIAQLRSRVAELSSPQINVLTLDVYPQEFIRRSDQNAVNEIEIPRGVKTVSLILNSQSASVAAKLSLEIVNASGATVWRAQNLQRHATNDYTINLPADFLPPGNYTFNVIGMVEGKRAKLDSYQIRIKPKR